MKLTLRPPISGGPLLIKSAVLHEFVIVSTCYSEGGRLEFESVGKADLLSNHFDSKQFMEAVDLLLTCHPSSNLTTFAFRSRVVRRLLLDLDPCDGTDPLGMFPPFLSENC